MLMLDKFLEMHRAWRDVLEALKVMTKSKADGGNRAEGDNQKPMRWYATSRRVVTPCRASGFLDIEARWRGGLATQAVPRRDRNLLCWMEVDVNFARRTCPEPEERADLRMRSSENAIVFSAGISRRLPADSRQARDVGPLSAFSLLFSPFPLA